MRSVIELALGLGVAGATTLGMGIFHPHSTLFGPTLWHGPRDRPQVALTFDDGPHATFTPRVARILEEHGARGTFFCVGSAVERNRDVVRALVAAGHELANHSYTHSTFGDLFSAARLGADLARNQEVLSAYGPAPRFYRPVAGVRNPEVQAAARQVGLSIVTWSHAARDGVWSLTAEKARRIATRTRPGDILAFHDGTLSNQIALREATVRELPRLLADVRSRGLDCVTLSELLTDDVASDLVHGQIRDPEHERHIAK